MGMNPQCRYSCDLRRRPFMGTIGRGEEHSLPPFNPLGWGPSGMKHGAPRAVSITSNIGGCHSSIFRACNLLSFQIVDSAGVVQVAQILSRARFSCSRSKTWVAPQPSAKIPRIWLAKLSIPMADCGVSWWLLGFSLATCNISRCLAEYQL